MLLFGHTGITLGAAVLLNGILIKRCRLCTRKIKMTESFQASSEIHCAQEHPHGSKLSSLTSLANYIDIRLLLIGSLLPDIIDKPLGIFFLRDSLSNGRIFCHTLAFLLLITLTGFYLYQRYGKTWMLTLSFGTFTHLILDQMWKSPQTLLWPLFGLAFPKAALTGWLSNIIHALFTTPEVYVSEIVGAAVIIWFMWVLLRSRTFCVFIRQGRVSYAASRHVPSFE